jgi:hypothetical protein
MVGDDSNEQNFPLRVIFAQGSATTGVAMEWFDRVAEVNFYQVIYGFDSEHPELGF